MAEGRRTSPLSRAAAVWLLALLAVPLLEFGLWEAWHDAPTYDEGIYLASGIDTLTSHRWRLTLEHPPLSRVLAALPALIAHPALPATGSARRGDEYQWTRDFLRANERAGRLRRVFFLGRLLPLLEAIATGLVIYAVATELTDRAGGVVAAGLWYLLPTTLAFGHVLSVDVTLALTTLLTAWAAVRVTRRPSWLAAVLLGIATGADLLVRSTAVFVVPVTALVAAGAAIGIGSGRGNLVRGRGVLREFWRGLAAAAGVAVTAGATVWAGIRLMAPVQTGGLNAMTIPVPFSGPTVIPRAESTLASVPWPPEYAAGIRLLGRLSVPAPGFAFGHRWTGVWWPAWPAYVLAKVPAPALILGALGLAGWAGYRAPARWRAAVVLGPLAVVTAVPVLGSTRELGVRLLVPVLALLAVAAAPAARLLHTSAGKTVITILLMLQLVALGTAAGSPLAWTTPPLHPAYRYVADSNLDWGQDWYAVEAWARHHPAAIAFFGSPGLQELLPGRDLLHARAGSVSGWVAASASYVTDYRAPSLAWLRSWCPVATIGSTVLVYRFATPPSWSARGAPSVPRAPCRQATFSHR